MRVGLDVTPLIGPLTGVGVFTRRLVDGLVGASGDGADLELADLELAGLAFTARGRGELERVVPASLARGRPIPARLARAAWLRANLPTASMLVAGDLDIVHGTNFVVPPGGGAAELVTIHDFGPWTTPDLVTKDARDFPALVARAIDRGAHVHVVSAFVAEVAAVQLDLPAERIHAIGLGVDRPDPGATMSAALAARIDRRPFVLAVGSVVPRKNFGELVRAVGALADDHPELLVVIAGSEDVGSAALDVAVEEAGLAPRVIRTGYVSDADKSALLREAVVVASTAVHEGFGMVPLEAMAASTPVVAVAGGAIPEVCGDAALLVEADDTDGFAGALDRVLTDSGLADELVARGRAQVEQYSWQAMVDQMVQLYRRLVE